MYLGSADQVAIFSPNGGQFLIVTRRGDIDRNINVESILLFRSNEVERTLGRGTPNSIPSYRIIFEKEVIHDWALIRDLRWISETIIAFMSEGQDGSVQAFTIDTSSGVSTQITHSDTDVAGFGLSRDQTVFYAYANPIPRQVVHVGDASLYELLTGGERSIYRPFELFKANGSAREPTKISAQPEWSFPTVRRIWVSPSGNLAIVLSPATQVPAHWAEYAVEEYKTESQRANKDPTSQDLVRSLRYQLVDIITGEIRPLLDAPVVIGARHSRLPMDVFWMEDERSVVISNTFLPLSGVSSAEREARAKSVAVAEVVLETGRVRSIHVERLRQPSRGEFTQPPPPLVKLRWDTDSSTLVLRETAGDSTNSKEFRRAGARWQTKRGSSSTEEPSYRIHLKSELNRRPVVVAEGGECQCAREIYDPAPYADDFSFGVAREMRWVDRNHIEWRGSVTYPPGYTSGTRHPLIVQTHGFEPDKFLIDGPGSITTAMATQALANAGFVVLQIEDSAQAFDPAHAEASRFAEGYRSGIATLIASGEIDPDRVGLTAFSRTGLPVIALLAEHPDLVQAVCISDAAWWGYITDAMLLNEPEGRKEIRAATGAPVPGKYGEWFQANPIYQSSLSHAPVRFEAMSVFHLLLTWEHFAVWKDSGRPVDLVYFPQGSHNVFKPAERLESQGGTLDWFRFWLNGEEDVSPEKADQYKRWRLLRSSTGR